MGSQSSKKRKLEISQPYSATQALHIEYDSSQNSFRGVPLQWRDAFQTPSLSLSQTPVTHSFESSIRALPPSPSFPAISQELDVLVNETNPLNLYKQLVLFAKGNRCPVYSAVDTCVGSKVAIKVVSQKDKERVQVAKKEINTLNLCRCKNVVNLIGSYLTQDNIWLVFEFMDFSLSDFLSPKVSKFVIQGLLFHILEGLSFIHSKNIIHRDIRSDSILLNKHGHVKLCHFSFASNPSSEIVGNPHWIAPEIIQLKLCSPKSDVWSLGILIYELCHSIPPRVSLDPNEILHLTVLEGAPLLNDGIDVDADLIRIYQQCTNLDPNSRPSSLDLLNDKFVFDNDFLKEWINKLV